MAPSTVFIKLRESNVYWAYNKTEDDIGLCSFQEIFLDLMPDILSNARHSI